MGANVASLGVEIPPVKGAVEAAASLNIVKQAADYLGVSVEKMGDAVAAAQKKLDSKVLAREATRAADAIRQVYGVQSATAKEAAKQMGTLQSATVSAGAAISGWVKHMLAAAAAIFTVHEAWKLFTSSLKAAGNAQAGETTLKLMIGNAQAAARAIQQIKVVAANVKIFDDDELTQAAIKLKAAGVGTQNLGTYLQGLSVLSAKAGVDVEAMSQAWLQAMHGNIRSSTVESDTIMKQLGLTTGKSMRDVRQGLRDGSIGASEFTKALIDASKNTDVLAVRQGDYNTKLRMFGNAWEDVKKAFGEPIIDALSPIIATLTETMDSGKSRAAEWGESTASALEKVAKALENIGTAWEKAKNFFLSKPGGGNGLQGAGYGFDPFNIRPPQIDPTTGLPKGWKVLGEGNIPKPAGIDTIKPPGGSLSLDATNQALDDMQEKMRDLTKDFSGDYRTIIDYWEEYSKIQAFSTDATSRHWHQMELLQKTIKDLGHPMEDVKKLLPGLSPDEAALAKWIAWREEADRAIQMTELRMRAGMASMGDSVKHGLDKMTASWGTWQQQVSASVQDIGNAIAGGITNGLADILQGTKSVKEGFREMALAIINDIEHIIIKMMVQLAIQQLIAAAGGGGYGGVTSFLGNIAQGTGGHAAGGRIGGTGSGDIVPAMLEPGEFVIRRDAARKIGYSRLQRWNKMNGGGIVYDDQGHPIEGASPSWYTSPHGQGPVTGPWWQPPDDLPGGPQVVVPRDSSRDRVVDNPVANRFLSGMYGGLSGFGTSPSFGISMFGPTASPTFWVNYPGVGNVPMAIPASGWGADPSQWNAVQHHHTPPLSGKRAGGVVSSYHNGGIVTGMAAYASGGVVAAGEGVFTPRQMRAMGPSGNVNVSNVQVNVNVSKEGQVSASASGSGSGSQDQTNYRELGRMVGAFVDQRLSNSRRVGGIGYVSRAQRGG